MKRNTVTALLLTCILLCTGCAGQTSASSTADSGTPVTEPAVSSEAETEPETTESAEETSAAAETESAAETEAEQPAAEQPEAPQIFEEASPIASVMIEGDFNATVRALLPDYVNDEETVRAAVLQLFQDVPFFIILTPEICGQLEVGGNYMFHIPEQEITTEKNYLFDDGTLSPDAIKTGYTAIDSVRAPKEDEYGLDSWFVKYTSVS